MLRGLSKHEIEDFKTFLSRAHGKTSGIFFREQRSTHVENRPLLPEAYFTTLSRVHNPANLLGILIMPHIPQIIGSQLVGCDKNGLRVVLIVCWRQQRKEMCSLNSIMYLLIKASKIRQMSTWTGCMLSKTWPKINITIKQKHTNLILQIFFVLFYK